MGRTHTAVVAKEQRGRCVVCGYILYGAASGLVRCPECGTTQTGRDAWYRAHGPWSWRLPPQDMARGRAPRACARLARRRVFVWLVAPTLLYFGLVLGGTSVSVAATYRNAFSGQRYVLNWRPFTLNLRFGDEGTTVPLMRQWKLRVPSLNATPWLVLGALPVFLVTLGTLAWRILGSSNARRGRSAGVMALFVLQASLLLPGTIPVTGVLLALAAAEACLVLFLNWPRGVTGRVALPLLALANLGSLIRGSLFLARLHGLGGTTRVGGWLRLCAAEGVWLVGVILVTKIVAVVFGYNLHVSAYL